MSTKVKGKAVRSKKKQDPKSKKAVTAFFASETALKVGAPTSRSPNTLNMAPSPTSQSNDTAHSDQEEERPINKKDLDLLRLDIHKYFNEAIVEHIKPLKEKINELSEDLNTTASIAERSAELGLSLKGELTALRESESKLQSRLMLLENKWRALNIKLRGFDEGAEEKKDLLIFVADWLQTTFSLPENMATSIIRVQRLGAILPQQHNFTRDILVQFSNTRIKDLILQKARQRDGATYNGKKILILLDLSPETLEKRKKLKIVSSKLHASNLRFRWSPMSDLLLFKNGAFYKAQDAQSGLALMNALSIKYTEEEEDELRKNFESTEDKSSPEEVV